jgi:predicted adenine nucleotide alpha hydrolase (AANH) superfamily ATPase
MKLLLHTCCAPCSVQCVESLKREGIKPDLFWYNPNIHPFTEYRTRRDTLVQFAKETDLALTLDDEYGLRSFIRGVYPTFERSEGTQQPASDHPRCAYCYRTRLEKTAACAAAHGYESFSTTLLISPYQNHGLIRELGEELAAACGVEFLYRDFRPCFREGQNQARAKGYYMQKYCGCIFSEEERYDPKKRLQ